MPVILYRSWRDFPLEQWRWPSFSPAEMACRGTGQLMIDEAALDKLQALRDFLGKPMIVHSAFRTPDHNKVSGGAKNSQHLYARAFDISMANHDPAAFEQAARAVGFTGFGYYVKKNFMHIDTGPARTWGKPFPPRPVTRRVETAGDDPELDDAETERFAEEPKQPTIIETIAKPEVIGPVAGTGLMGLLGKFGDALATSLPLQIAMGVLLVAVPLGLGWWFFVRARSVRVGD